MRACWLCSVAIVPRPEVAEPEETSAETWCAPPPLSPLTGVEVQVDPVAEVQIWALRWPGGPDWLAAAKPSEVAVSAVTATPGPAEPNGFSLPARAAVGGQFGERHGLARLGRLPQGDHVIAGRHLRKRRS